MAGDSGGVGFVLARNTSRASAQRRPQLVWQFEFSNERSTALSHWAVQYYCQYCAVLVAAGANAYCFSFLWSCIRGYVAGFHPALSIPGRNHLYVAARNTSDLHQLISRSDFTRSYYITLVVLRAASSYHPSGDNNCNYNVVQSAFSPLSERLTPPDLMKSWKVKKN